MEIALNPDLDFDGDLRLDICQGGHVWTPDATTSAGETLLLPVHLDWNQIESPLQIRDLSFFVGFESDAMKLTGLDIENTLLGLETWETEWFMASDTHFVVFAHGEVPLSFFSSAPLLKLPFAIEGPLMQEQPVRIHDFVFNRLSTSVVDASNGMILSSLSEPLEQSLGVAWYVAFEEGQIEVFFDLEKNASLTFRLWDLMGRPISSFGEGAYPAGSNHLSEKVSSTLPAGIYLVELRGEGQAEYLKVFIAR